MNRFIHIDSNGGYIGRFSWHNKGAHKDLDPWGAIIFMPDSILRTGWAGDYWLIRALVNAICDGK